MSKLCIHFVNLPEGKGKEFVQEVTGVDRLDQTNGPNPFFEMGKPDTIHNGIGVLVNEQSVSLDALEAKFKSAGMTGVKRHEELVPKNWNQEGQGVRADRHVVFVCGDELGISLF